MTSTLGTKVSIFTTALLKDTGFYADINDNFTSELTYFKDKGCDLTTSEIEENRS